LSTLRRNKILKLMDNQLVAKVIAGEAANQGELGMRAVACVIANRCRAQDKEPIDIVTQPHQFSCITDYKLLERNYADVKEIVDALAAEIYSLYDITGGALNYLTINLFNLPARPAWVDDMRVTKIIGDHVFMRPV